MTIVRSILFFILSGVCEIGGGYLVWIWLKEGKPLYNGIFGFIILALYGAIATLQTANFARSYATYGGVFIVLSLLWAWKVDDFKPDKYDIIGAVLAILGVAVIMYAPRK